MIKNAIEASQEQDTIELECGFVNEMVVFMFIIRRTFQRRYNLNSSTIRSQQRSGKRIGFIQYEIPVGKVS